MNAVERRNSCGGHNSRRPTASGCNVRGLRGFRRQFATGYCRRGGYALVMVLVFVVLFLTILGVAWRQIGAVMRIESVRAKQTTRDRGSLRAVAEGLRLLETGLPPDGYACGKKFDGESQWYSVTFTKKADDPENPDDDNVWTVAAIPVSEQPEETMPSTFPPP